jgi:hypothetical protein
VVGSTSDGPKHQFDQTASPCEQLVDHAEVGERCQLGYRQQQLCAVPEVEIEVALE